MSRGARFHPASAASAESMARANKLCRLERRFLQLLDSARQNLDGEPGLYRRYFVLHCITFVTSIDSASCFGCVRGSFFLPKEKPRGGI